MTKKKGGGGKLNRSEIIQARLDPKLHMAAEILGRYQRRTLSSLIEVLLGEAINKIKIPATFSDNTQIEYYLMGRKKREKQSIKDITDAIWSDHEADRFAMLALLLPDFLTTEEISLWNLITYTPYFWAHFDINIESKSGRVLGQQNWPLVSQKGLIREHLREHWPLLKDILDGKKTADDIKKLKLPVGSHIEKPSDYPHDIKKVNPSYVD